MRHLRIDTLDIKIETLSSRRVSERSRGEKLEHIFLDEFWNAIAVSKAQ